MPQLKSSSKLLANLNGRLVRAVPLVAVLVTVGAGMTPAQERVNATGAAIKAFLDRVNVYIALQHKLESGLPALTPRDDPSKMEVHQRALAARMRLARPKAEPGDVFGDAGVFIRAVVVKDARERSVRDAKAAMEEVPKGRPRVNAEYPETAALATVPPLLLANLPRLPEGLEYRFMGRDLILRDTKTNLIADFIHEAAPNVKR